MVDVLAVGAHPDDVEIAIGGTLVNLIRSGRSVAICHATDGEPTPRGTRETRLAEARRAAKLLGAALHLLDMPNRYLRDTIENRVTLAVLIRRLRPKLMLVPYDGGAHPDHRIISRIADAARFYGKLTKEGPDGKPWPLRPHWTPRLFYYMGLGIHRQLVQPSFVVDISKAYRKKMRVLACYRSQFSIDLENLPPQDFWGPLIGVDHGEAFISPEPIGIDDIFAVKKVTR